MNKILVPTDFSEPSKVAVLYAARMAKKLNAEITLLSVVDVNPVSQTVMKMQRLEEVIIEGAEDDANALIGEIKEKIDGEVVICYELITGFPVHEKIEKFVLENGIDMIIMGTHGTTGLKKVLIGSNAAAVIDNSSVPVIAVPNDAKFDAIQKIVYATDLVNVNEEIKTIGLFASLFEASINVLHVRSIEAINNVNVEEAIADLKKQAKYEKITFTIKVNNHVAEAVEEFALQEKADLLVMFTHKLDFYEKLFGRGITRELAFQGHVPLLTFNKTTLQ
jgi:nucleotide-binding universal stress UspA family protein